MDGEEKSHFPATITKSLVRLASYERGRMKKMSTGIELLGQYFVFKKDTE